MKFILLLLSAVFCVITLNGMEQQKVAVVRDNKSLYIYGNDQDDQQDGKIKEHISNIKDPDHIKHVACCDFTPSTKIIASLAIFSNLKRLNLSSNGLTSIDGIQELFQLRRLITLDLSHNELKSLCLAKPKESWSISLAKHKIINIGFLNVSYNDLESLDGLGIFDIEGGLDMSYNKIKDLKPLEHIIGSLGSFKADFNPVTKESLNVLVEATLNYKEHGYNGGIHVKEKTQGQREVQIYLIEWLLKKSQESNQVLNLKRKKVEGEIQEKKALLKKIKTDFESGLDEEKKWELLLVKKATELEMIQKFEEKK
jgi:hypothetical protein